MKTMIWVLLIILTGLPVILPGNPAPGRNGVLMNGYAEKISGTDYTYHSSIPWVRDCMLLRATDGKWSMEWKTSPVPRSVRGKYITFAWLAGIGSSPGKGRIILSINGKTTFSFITDGRRRWALTNKRKLSLEFIGDKVDQHGDHFGFMYLHIPAALVKKGVPLRLKMTGGNDQTTSWYMTFKLPLINSASFVFLPAIFKKGDQQKSLILVRILNFSPSRMAIVGLDGRQVDRFPVPYGFSYRKIAIPLITREQKSLLKIGWKGFTHQRRLQVKPVRKWKVNLVQHTHTDIGYTRPQTEILGEHLRFIDLALDFCDQTDHFPDPARFRWTCETSWAVGEYLKSRPVSQVDRLIRRVKEERIELTGMYLNFSELPDEQLLASSLKPLRNFTKMNLNPTVAMQNDINGIGWCLSDYFPQLGIRYLNMGTHGHRALICFDKPTLFWWESPSGARMLAYRGEHYMIGNTAFKLQEQNFNFFADKLLNYLADLEARGYPYPMVSLQHSGYITDNSPPSTAVCNLVRKWNEVYRWPELRTATCQEFFTAMESRYAGDFPVYRAHWPDWWTDGFGSAAREVSRARKTMSRQILNSNCLSMARLSDKDIPEQFIGQHQNINNHLLFYTEHTLGYSESIREPYNRNTLRQRALKEAYVWDAARESSLLTEKIFGLLHPLARGKEHYLVVYNPLNWERGGLTTVYLEHRLVPRGKSLVLMDRQGNNYPGQAVRYRSDGTYWQIPVKGIPPFGYKKFRITLQESGNIPPLAATADKQKISFENRWYKIRIDKQRGTINSLWDKELHCQLIDQRGKYQLGEFVLESLDNRHQLEALRLDSYQRIPLEKVSYDGYVPGAIYDSIHFSGESKTLIKPKGFKCQIRIYHQEKKIDFKFILNKQANVNPEGIYIAFPFHLTRAAHYVEVAGGLMEAGKDQLPGSANDWNTFQNFVLLKNRTAQIILGSAEAPLVQLGGINTGRFRARNQYSKGHIFGWLMNNYWTTNFNADQRGEHTWTYCLTSTGQLSPVVATRFGWNVRVPLYARVIPEKELNEQQWQESLIKGWPENVLLIFARPTEQKKELILLLREVSGRTTSISLLNTRSGKPFGIRPVNALNMEINPAAPKLNPYQSKFFRLSW